jgi:transposase InsO family protein
MGKLQQLKTNSGPAYISAAFQRFSETYQIHHTTGIPYNPQGQAIVEHAHATLKM